jgi:hypothetical protein
MKKTKMQLFEELSRPNKDGVSRWVKKSEFIDNYKTLYFDNGFPWGRTSSPIAKKYNLENDKTLTAGNSIDRIRLNGFNTSNNKKLSQAIRVDIKKVISKQRCIVLGTNRSCDHKVEVDHKDGRKIDERIMNTKTQTLEDFQPLSKPANDAKRQFCKKCKETNLRYDAKLLGYSISFIKGDINFTKEFGCNGCFWYDPVAFRQELQIKKL